MSDSWKVLGIEPTQDAIAIKKAYARLLKLARPDDDADAYQRLRTAYETALQAARLGVAPAAATKPREVQAPAPAEVAEVADSFDSELPPAPGQPAPVHDAIYPLGEDPVGDEGDGDVPFAARDALLALMTHAGQLETARFAQEWSCLEAAIDGLPLWLRAEASRHFVQLVLVRPGLDARTLGRIADYFSWGMDYRADELLGPDLAQRIRARLREQGARRLLDARALHRFGVPLQIDRLLEDGRDNLAALFAALAPPKFGDRLRAASPAELRGLGMGGTSDHDALTASTISVTMGLAGGLRLLVLAALIAGLLRIGFDVAPGAALASGALLALASAAVSIACRRVREVLDRGTRNAKITPLVRICSVVFALAAGTFYSAAANGNPIVIALLCSGAAWLLAWDVRVPWRAVLLPAIAAASLACASWFGAGQLHYAVLAGTAWALASHVASLRSADTVFAIYRAPWRMLPTTGGRWVLFIIFFKAVALFIGAALLAMMPLTYLMLGTYHGVAFGVAAFTVAATLGWLEPDLVIIWLILAPIALVMLQAGASWLSRRRQFLPRS